MKTPELHFIPDGGWCPNSPHRALLIYRDVLHGSDETLAEEFELVFAGHGWPPAWRYTIFDYLHYHSTTHEVIGIYRGEADVRLGDTTGFTARISAGDAIVIPAGVSHQRLWATTDFHGVGAYPSGCDVDEQRVGCTDRAVAEQRIAHLSVPTQDPLFGENGPLLKIWSEAKSISARASS